MTIKKWNIEAMTGYKPKTTFYEDFSMADSFGESAVKDTYKRAVATADGCGYVYLTELVMALNWKIWEHHHGGNSRYAALYNRLWDAAAEHAEKTLEGDELRYYYRTID